MKTKMITIFCKATSWGIILLLFFSLGFADTARPSKGSIDGTYVLSLPMPGGTRESRLVLSSEGEKITGTMSAPGNPEETAPVTGGRIEDGKFTLSAQIGRITYSLSGTHTDKALSFDMTTEETIPLGDGTRVSGKTGEITGGYSVPVYSPGGIKENRMDLAADKGIITGEMYVPGTSGEGAPSALPEGASAEAGVPQGGAPSDNGKRDLNIFYDGTYEGNRVSFYTKTGQGSIFHFTGTVEGDAIRLTMHVTDQKAGLSAQKI